MSKLGRYELVRKLASGGMAEVFLAKVSGPLGFQKSLVLKRMLPHLASTEEYVQMFLSEARVQAQLTHPNLVQIFDFGEADGNYFIAMEYVDGVTLRSVLASHAKRNTPLTVGVAARIMTLICEGLHFAHTAVDSETRTPLNIVHRDLSPDNVLISRHGAVKLFDFGIAKSSMNTHQTGLGVLKGKLAYMAPEQLKSENIDARADVFSLGIMLYEMMTGSRPINANTDAEIMRNMLFEPFVPARARRPDLPIAVENLLNKAIAKDRELRFASCEQLSQALEALLEKSSDDSSPGAIARLVIDSTVEAPAPSPASVPTIATRVHLPSNRDEVATRMLIRQTPATSQATPAAVPQGVPSTMATPSSRTLLPYLYRDTFTVRVQSNGQRWALVFTGQLKGSDAAALASLFDTVHTFSVEQQLKVLEVDMTGLESMSATHYSSFTHWLTKVKALPKQLRYQLQFRISSAPAQRWQNTVVTVLRAGALDHVELLPEK